MVTHPSILLIEDSPGECELFRLALEQTGLDVVLYTEQDSETAHRFLEGQLMAPAMVQSYSLNQDRSKGEAAGVVSTARVERGPSATARSASTGDQSDHPPSIPSLILLDLQLRGQNGCDFLKRLRSDARFAAIPVVVFTTSDDQTDLARCYANGANGYVVKPGTFDELIHCTRDICRYWLTWNRPLLMAETRC
jgi:CheY-like chemotaxis protein